MEFEYDNEIYSERVNAGKRTYFFDIKKFRRSEDDYFLTIAERRATSEGNFLRNKVFVSRRDLNKFSKALEKAIKHMKEALPDYDFERSEERKPQDNTE